MQNNSFIIKDDTTIYFKNSNKCYSLFIGAKTGALLLKEIINDNEDGDVLLYKSLANLIPKNIEVKVQERTKDTKEEDKEENNLEV